MLVLVSVMLVALLTLGGFAISIGQIQLARTEAQIVADAASLSAASLFGETPTGPVTTPREMAAEAAKSNTVFGKYAALNQNDVVLGRAASTQSGKFEFLPNSSPFNAVQVRVRMADGAAMGKMPLLFPFMLNVKAFGLDAASVSSKMAHDVALVLDRSQSMHRRTNGTAPPVLPPTDRPFANLYPHPAQSRWGLMLKALPSLFEAFGVSRIEERYTLVTFGSYREATINGVLEIYEGSTVDIAETRNPDDIMAVLEHMWDERPMLSGQTWIDAGLDDAVEVLTSDANREFAFKTVILVTDGEQFPKNGAHYPAAQRLAQKGITLHTIAYSLGAGSEEMQDLAQIGGGKFFKAPSAAELVEAFKQLGSMAPVAIIE